MHNGHSIHDGAAPTVCRSSDDPPFGGLVAALCAEMERAVRTWPSQTNYTAPVASKSACNSQHFLCLLFVDHLYPNLSLCLWCAVFFLQYLVEDLPDPLFRSFVAIFDLFCSDPTAFPSLETINRVLDFPCRELRYSFEVLRFFLFVFMTLFLYFHCFVLIFLSCLLRLCRSRTIFAWNSPKTSAMPLPVGDGFAFDVPDVRDEDSLFRRIDV